MTPKIIASSEDLARKLLELGQSEIGVDTKKWVVPFLEADDRHSEKNQIRNRAGFATVSPWTWSRNAPSAPTSTTSTTTATNSWRTPGALLSRKSINRRGSCWLVSFLWMKDRRFFCDDHDERFRFQWLPAACCWKCWAIKSSSPNNSPTCSTSLRGNSTRENVWAKWVFFLEKKTESAVFARFSVGFLLGL